MPSPHDRRAGKTLWRFAAALAACVAVCAQAAVLQVSNTNDSGAGSLRQTILGANPADTVSLSTLSGTISLALPIDITKPLTVVGPGANVLAISGGGTRLFNVIDTVTISGLTLQNGTAGFAVGGFFGGAISNSGNLTLDKVALRNNQAYDAGGAIYNISKVPGMGQLTLRACELSDNTVTGVDSAGAGAIYSTSNGGAGASVTIVNSTFNNNSASAALQGTTGGAIYASRGSLTIVGSTIDGNAAGAAGGNIHVGTLAGTNLSLRNTLIGDATILAAGVTATDRDIFQPSGATVTSLGYNIVQRRSAATGYAATDAADGTGPQLTALAANGGATKTMKPAGTSPALGFVPLPACLDEASAPLLIDQRGTPRRAAGAPFCDAGAVELARATATTFSRKTHAGTPYNLPLNGNVPIGGAVSVEPRAGGSGHIIVFQFGSPVATVGSARAIDAQGQPVGSVGPLFFNGNEVSVNLSNIPDAKRVSILLNGVNGDFNAGVSLGFLLGDVGGNRLVNAASASAVKGRAGQAVDGGNFLYDLNLTGLIGASDIAAAKARNGAVLP